MSYRAQDALAKEIVEKLTNLTDRGAVEWKQNGHEFTATYQGLIFSTDNSGQNWLYVKRHSGEDLDVIQDSLGFIYVEELVSSIKRQVNSGIQNCRRAYFSVPDRRQSILTDILETLIREA